MPQPKKSAKQPETAPEPVVTPDGPVKDGGVGAFDETDGQTSVTAGGEVVDTPKARVEHEDGPAPEPTEPTNEPDHQQLGPNDVDPTSPQSTGTVYLPRLLVDEFGMTESVARESLLIGTVTVDGEPYNGDRLNFPYDKIVGKEIVLKSEYRSARFTYNG